MQAVKKNEGQFECGGGEEGGAWGWVDIFSGDTWRKCSTIQICAMNIFLHLLSMHPNGPLGRKLILFLTNFCKK